MNTPTPAAAAPPAQGGAAVVISDDAAAKVSGRRAALLISTLLLGVLSFQLNASMVTPALPQIAASFGQSPDSAAPVQPMFFLAGAVAGPVIGRWSDFSVLSFAGFWFIEKPRSPPAHRRAPPALPPERLHPRLIEQRLPFPAGKDDRIRQAPPSYFSCLA